ncbi:MAG: CHAD domain-containing protein, partial [Desulfobacterales bacterium]
MGFQLQAGEPLADGIRRIALGRIDKALSQLTNPGFNRDLAVHEARKTCKRLRAVLRLIRDEVRTSYYRQENVRFRDASRLLAPARDSAVMVETLDALVTRFEDTETIKTNAAIDPFSAIDFLPLPVEPIADLREKLVERHHTLSRRVLETDAVPNFITSLR